MTAVLVFFAIAVLCGCLIRGVVELRTRAAVRRPDVGEEELCQLRQANRISSFTIVASLVGLAVVGLVFVLV